MRLSDCFDGCRRLLEKLFKQTGCIFINDIKKSGTIVQSTFSKAGGDSMNAFFRILTSGAALVTDMGAYES
jgi:hypothetical protein